MECKDYRIGIEYEIHKSKLKELEDECNIYIYIFRKWS